MRVALGFNFLAWLCAWPAFLGGLIVFQILWAFFYLVSIYFFVQWLRARKFF